MTTTTMTSTNGLSSSLSESDCADQHRLPMGGAERTWSRLSSGSELPVVPMITIAQQQPWNLARPSLAICLFVLLTISWSLPMVEATSPSCATDADCHVRGIGHCKKNFDGSSQCSYASCAIGYYGASAAYDECVACPQGMTSLAGKAFYASDCFIACGTTRCYAPEDGSADCEIIEDTAEHICHQSCLQQGYFVSNPSKPYAACVAGDSESEQPLVKQVKWEQVRGQTQAKRIAEKKDTTHEAAERKRAPEPVIGAPVIAAKPKARGRRIRKKADLRSGPAAAMLVGAGKDPLALVSK